MGFISEFSSKQIGFGHPYKDLIVYLKKIHSGLLDKLEFLNYRGWSSNEISYLIKILN